MAENVLFFLCSGSAVNLSVDKNRKFKALEPNILTAQKKREFSFFLFGVLQMVNCVNVKRTCELFLASKSTSGYFEMSLDEEKAKMTRTVHKGLLRKFKCFQFSVTFHNSRFCYVFRLRLDYLQRFIFWSEDLKKCLESFAIVAAPWEFWEGFFIAVPNYCLNFIINASIFLAVNPHFNTWQKGFLYLKVSCYFFPPPTQIHENFAL